MTMSPVIDSAPPAASQAPFITKLVVMLFVLSYNSVLGSGLVGWEHAISAAR
jgi:hypothetical protein